MQTVVSARNPAKNGRCGPLAPRAARRAGQLLSVARGALCVALLSAVVALPEQLLRHTLGAEHFGAVGAVLALMWAAWSVGDP